jgi:hypothetical protein
MKKENARIAERHSQRVLVWAGEKSYYLAKYNIIN